MYIYFFNYEKKSDRIKIFTNDSASKTYSLHKNTLEEFRKYSTGKHPEEYPYFIYCSGEGDSTRPAKEKLITIYEFEDLFAIVCNN